MGSLTHFRPSCSPLASERSPIMPTRSHDNLAADAGVHIARHADHRSRVQIGNRHADLVERDYELQEVLDRTRAMLQTIAHIRTPEHDDLLSEIEAAAKPYALAFVHEIARLDALVVRGMRRQRKVG
jgi:hypothetical protein